ncbi:MAG: glycosyltransferase family 39 protein [Planctomycetes bacterium]|nr:glycosyltransferase family 39 protein [Planctomycetota bacterium]
MKSAGKSPASGRAGVDAMLFAGIALVALLVRLVYLHQARAVPMFDALIEDGESYGAWSDRLASGDWLGKDVFYQAPLYPYFLGVVKLVFGRDLATIRLVQALLGSLACGVLFLAGQRFFSRRAGVASGLLLAFYPSAIFFDGCIQKSNLGLVLATLLLLALALLRERTSLARSIALGFVLGLLMLTREESILLVPVLLLLGRRHARGEGWPVRARFGAGYALGLLLALAPVAWRNHAVGGEWVLTTSQAGSNFFIGNHPDAPGYYVPLKAGRSNVAYERQDATDIAELVSRRKLTPKEVSSFWFGESFKWIRAHPRDWFTVLGRKAFLCANAYEMPDAEDMYFYERYVPLLHALDWILPWGVLVPLCIAGIWHFRSRWRELAAPLALLATLAAGVVAFYVFARYRYSLVPGLTLFGGALLVELWDARRALASLRSTWIALAIAVVIVDWPLYPRDFQLPASYGNAAITLDLRGDHAGAIRLYREALALRPDSAQTRGNLGLALEHAGHLEEAITEYRAVLAQRNGHVYDLLRLANALAQAGHLAECPPLLAQAETQATNDAVAWRDLANVYTQVRRYADALRCARRSLELDPRGREARLRAAWLLACAPDPALRNGGEALALVQSAVRDGAGGALALETLAAALAELGRFDEALAQLARGGTGAQHEALLAAFARHEAWRLPPP